MSAGQGQKCYRHSPLGASPLSGDAGTGRLGFHFSSLWAPGRRECLDHLVTISMPEEQEEQSGSACAEGKAEAFINDPLSYLRDTF